MKKDEDKDILEDLTSVTLPKGKLTEVELPVVRQGVITGIDVKVAGRINEVLGIKDKGKSAKEANLPAHIRKAYITINDKKPNDPVSITFNGEWTGMDINLAGKHLILEYNTYVRNRAIRGK